MTHFDTACGVLRKLKEAGFTSYFAGGWVRDYLMEHPSDDIDIATHATVEEIQALFPKTIPVGAAFGIVIVVEDGHQFEVATFRKDMGYVDGRRPTGYEHSTPEEDAKRRDFTINGMFYDPFEKKVLDFVGGRKDLKAGIIRAIGDPHERFLEDRLRMIRAVRYAGRFHFDIEAETEEAILAHADQLFPAVAIERVWQELSKMARYPHFEKAIAMLHRHDLLQTIFPKLKKTPLEEIERRCRFIPDFPKETPVIALIFELFPNTTLKQKLDLCDHFKLSNNDRAFATSYHAISKEFDTNSQKPADWAHTYADPHYRIILAIYAAHVSNQKGFLKQHHDRERTLADAIDRIKRRDPILKAKHLIEHGIPPGKQLGELLEKGERLSINENLTTPEAIIAHLRDVL